MANPYQRGQSTWKPPVITPWTPFKVVELTAEDRARVKDAPDVILANSRYQVIVRDQETPLGTMTHLSIKRLDKNTVKDWRDFQRIKNEVLGVEREAVELYPAESRLVDTSNQYHLWVLPAGMMFPFGYGERLVTETSAHGSKQRPFEEKPADLASREDIEERLKCGSPSDERDPHLEPTEP